MANIILKNVTKVYEKSGYGLIDFDCEINNGEFVTVIGPSGSGKTTFLKLIAGLLTPDCGEMYIDNVLVNEIPPQKRNIAMMFQEYALYPNYNVFENVAAYLKFKKVDIETINKVTYNALDMFGVKELANRSIKELSGGQKQRVALAKVFVRTPDVLLLDEPLSNVDEVNRLEYRSNIKKLKEMLPNTTFVYVTHNLPEAISLGERILYIEEGQSRFLLNPIDISNYPANLTLAKMIQSSELQYLKTLNNEDFYKPTVNKKESVIIKYNNKSLAYDENDCLIGGVNQFIKISGDISNDYFKIGNIKLAIPNELKLRLLNTQTKAYFYFDINKMHKNNFNNDFKIIFEIEKNNDDYKLVNFLGDKVLINSNEIKLLNECVYYNLFDLKIYDDCGNKILTNYNIYPNLVNVEAKKGKVFIGDNKIFVNHNGDIIFPLDSFELLNKKCDNSFKVKAVISEEIINNDKKLIYAVVDGFEHYVCFYVPKRTLINYKAKNYLKINLYKLILK